MNTFLARQPIFDRRLRVYAYELLYRANANVNAAGLIVDADQASSETILTGFSNIGIDRLTGGKRAFINFTAKLLESGVATLFPKDHLVVEILEDVPPTETILHACRQLKEAGYTIALDDFSFRPEMLPFVEIADIIKVDFLADSIPNIRKQVEALKRPTPLLLAEKVETQDVFDQARDMGCRLFQGYFFSKPLLLVEKKLDPLTVNIMHLIRLMNRSDITFPRLARVVGRDVALSYRLLRLVNSAYFGMRHKIQDITHALTILGMREVRKWISLLSMADLGQGKPDELIRMSLIRGRFLEIYALQNDKELESHLFFMAGLFSLLDVMMDISMKDVLSQLSLPGFVSQSLTGNGLAAQLLKALEAYEKSDWQTALTLSMALDIDARQLIANYLDALTWSDRFGEYARREESDADDNL